MSLNSPSWLWSALAVAAVAAAFIGGAIGDGVSALVAVFALVLAVRSVRRLGRGLSVRLLTLGGVLIGVGPLLSELHRAVLGDHRFTTGDVIALTGYVAFIAGLRRLVLVRTVAPQPQVLADSALGCSWLMLMLAVLPGEAVVAATDGLDTVIAFSYVPFTVVLIFYLLRLVLGARERSMSFVLLLAAAATVGIAEVFFLQVAAGDEAFRTVGVMVATLALVLFGAAVSHPSAADLETPSPFRAARFTVLRAVMLVLSFVAVTIMPVVIELTAFEVGLVIVTAVLTSVRIVVLVAEREDWVRLEQRFRMFAAQLVEGESVEELRTIGLSAVEGVLTSKDLCMVDIRVGGEVAETLADQADPSGVHLNEIDGDVWRAIHTGESQKMEFAVRHGRSRYATRLVIPFDAGSSGRGVLLVESHPVLSTAEISHLELVGASLGLAIATANERAENQTERANRKFRSLVQDSNDIVLLVSPRSLKTSLASPTTERLLGYANGDFLDASPFIHLYPEDAARAEHYLLQRQETVEPIDVRIHHADGQLRWFALSIRDMSHDEELAGWVLNFNDIHGRKMAEVQLSSSENRFRSLIEHSDDVFALVSDDLRLTFVSPNVHRMLGYSAADLIGSHITGLVTPDSMESLAEFVESPLIDLDGRMVEIELKTRHGERRWVAVTITHGAVEDDDSAMVAVRDITERRELEEGMRAAALHDPLTGLYNRASLQHEIHQSLQRMTTDEFTGVLHLDVRDFRVVNESLGFEVGDQLLIEVASRLRSGLRGDDALARLGADSFVVVTRASSPEELREVAHRLSGVFIESFAVGDRHHHLGVAVGIASTNDRRETAVTLLEESALAVRRAKADKSAVVLYQSWMREAATERFELEADLLPGLAAGQFNVVYQPLLTLSSNEVRGVEALLRWQHPERGHVSPATFIPLAEASGSITELGRWVLDTSCRQLVTWHAELPDAGALGVSVNVSARQLEDRREFDVLHDIIRSSGVDPKALTLELTETTMIDGIDGVRSQLERFRSLGIRIAVDDFGTGTAGLNHLRDVPFDVLKVDKTYIDPLGRVDDAYSLLAGVVDLAHAMGAIVVAEGIETPAQANELRRMSCDVGQGFYLGRPMDRARIENWFARGREGNVASQIQQVRA